MPKGPRKLKILENEKKIIISEFKTALFNLVDADGRHQRQLCGQLQQTYAKSLNCRLLFSSDTRSTI